jgi:hypothetical protein
MPQLGHGTGFDSRTSGHMGQTYVPWFFSLLAGAATGLRVETAGMVAACVILLKATNPADGCGLRYLSGSALNFSSQDFPQK